MASLEDFVEATNVGLVRIAGGEWTGNFDAFNDYLSWPDEEYELQIIGADDCAASLGHEAMATWIEGNILTAHPSNAANLRGRLASARQGRGPTLFEFICTMVRDNPHVRLILS